MDTEYEYITRTYSKCNNFSNHKYNEPDLQYNISEENFKCQKDIETNTVLTINSFDRFENNTGCQHHEIIHEVKHIQVEQPKFVQEETLVMPLSENIPTKQSLKLVIPKSQQETLEYGKYMPLKFYRLYWQKGCLFLTAFIVTVTVIIAQTF